MSYWLLMAMLKDNNVLHERPSKEEKKDENIKRGGGMAMAAYM